VVTEDGGVYMWGALDAYALGEEDLLSPGNPLPCTHPALLNPRRWVDAGAHAAEDKKVVNAELGSYSVALVTEEGGLYCFGLGEYGGPGHGSTHHVYFPTRVTGGLEHEHVVTARLGNTHTVVLTEAGRVWTFGTNPNGQLGTGWLGSGTQVFGPQLLAGILCGVKVVHISCGGTHTIAVAETGRMLSWGLNDVGQLGVGDNLPRFTPTEIEGAIAQERVVFTSSSTATNAAVTTTNAIWLWGLNSSGQMGLGKTDAAEFFCVLHPMAMPKVRHMENVSAVACHDQFTLALNTNKRGMGEVWVWGRSDEMSAWQQVPLGNGNWRPALKPTLITGELAHHSVVSVSCGRWHVIALTEEGRIFTWGRGRVELPEDEMEEDEEEYRPHLGAPGHGENDVLGPKLLAQSIYADPLPPIGRLRPLSRDKALAFAMAAQSRLGGESLARLLMAELIQRILDCAAASIPRLSPGVLRLMGGGYTQPRKQLSSSLSGLGGGGGGGASLRRSSRTIKR
jgi:alpha-tubulin suppressor-like RCC1 family protein